MGLADFRKGNSMGSARAPRRSDDRRCVPAHGPGPRLADRVRDIGAIRASLLLADQRLEAAAVEAEIAAEQDRADRERAEREAATQTSSNTPQPAAPPPASAPSLPSPPPGGSDGATQAIAFAKAQLGEPLRLGHDVEPGLDPPRRDVPRRWADRPRAAHRPPGVDRQHVVLDAARLLRPGVTAATSGAG